jgi:uncharacterized protein YraI
VVLPGAAAAATFAIAEAGTTNVRSGPGTNYAVIGRVHGGTQVSVGDCVGGWCGVATQGLSGYMAQSRLEFGYASAAPVVVQPQPYPVPVYRTHPYYSSGFYGYGGPVVSFSFGSFDRDRHDHDWWDRRDHDRDWDWNDHDRRGDNDNWWWRRIKDRD